MVFRNFLISCHDRFNFLTVGKHLRVFVVRLALNTFCPKVTEDETPPMISSIELSFCCPGGKGFD